MDRRSENTVVAKNKKARPFQMVRIGGIRRRIVNLHYYLIRQTWCVRFPLHVYQRSEVRRSGEICRSSASDPGVFSVRIVSTLVELRTPDGGGGNLSSLPVQKIQKRQLRAILEDDNDIISVCFFFCGRRRRRRKQNDHSVQYGYHLTRGRLFSARSGAMAVGRREKNCISSRNRASIGRYNNDRIITTSSSSSSSSSISLARILRTFTCTRRSNDVRVWSRKNGPGSGYTRVSSEDIAFLLFVD